MKDLVISLNPVAYVCSPRDLPVDDDWGEVISEVKLCDNIPSEALLGLNEFSHIEVVYYFNQVPDDRIQTGARHPRSNMRWPLVGILAQRGKNRPNKLGVSVARIVEVHTRSIVVVGLDAIDGTPVLDLKPVMTEFLPRGELQQPQWSRELMKDYWTKGSESGPRD